MIFSKFFKAFSILFICLSILSSCGSVKKLNDLRKPVDLRKEPLDPDERAKRNIAEGRGISIKNLGGSGKTTYEFSTSNPMWRATLESLDFLPLSTVDYSGGLIISDWYSDGSKENESLKITVRFLSNEVRSNSLKIQVHQRQCFTDNRCSTKLIKSQIGEELAKVILSKAATLEKSKDQKNKYYRKIIICSAIIFN